MEDLNENDENLIFGIRNDGTFKIFKEDVFKNPPEHMLPIVNLIKSYIILEDENDYLAMKLMGYTSIHDN